LLVLEDVIMTTFDFTPLFRSTVGFDRLMNLLESSGQWTEAANGYPPYNIEKTGQDQYRITVAVAGFSEGELSVDVRENVLLVEGRKKESENGNAYLYRGIAGRSFKRQFQLADYVRPSGAELHNGLLTVNLVRELPETMKPRRIPIAAVGDTPKVTVAPSETADDNAAAA
jgi:molecular chaperone IbpA